MILATTSHRPTRRVRSLCNDLVLSIPGLVRVNRGKMSLLEVAERALQLGSNKFIVVDRWKGGPGRIRFFSTSNEVFREVPPRIYVSGVKLRREFNIPHEWIKGKINFLFLNVSGNVNPEIEKFSSSISEFFRLPVFEKSAEVMGYEAYMNISTGEDCWVYMSFFLLPRRVEIGPCIKISHVVWDI